MPEQKTIERARRAEHQGKAPSTQAGEFVREEMEHVREGKHSVRSQKQAVAIGLSKARRAGVKLPPPKKGATSTKTRRKAERDYEVGQSQRKKSIGSSATAGKRGRKTEGKRTPSSSTKTAKKRKTTSQAKSRPQARTTTKSRRGRSATS